ncbi:regulatory signaling modulator protein AmpE [Salmonella enterica subsp. enterica]|nr:regulatory signaling modulator protein AmpE [Salmonella enterica subsp. enterica]
MRELQNALWINFPFYLPLFWFIVGGRGAGNAGEYAFLRARRARLARAIDAAPAFAIRRDAILHVLDWIPVRLAGVMYAMLGVKRCRHSFTSLADPHTSQHQVLIVWRSSHWRANHTRQSRNPQRRCRWRRRPCCGGGDYCVAHHLWGISTLCRWR